MTTTGSTITGVVMTDGGITLGTGGYGSPLTITSSGYVGAKSQDSPAIFIYSHAVQTLINAGDVAGGLGGAGVEMLTTGVLTNTGLIVAGDGGQGVNNTYVDGGTGILAVTDATITNSGYISGGDCTVYHRTFNGRAGGAGIFFDAAGTLTNLGTVTGGYGGNGYDTSSDFYPTAGGGGVGVNASNDPGNVILNAGTIFGGAGGVDVAFFQSDSGAGGAGVVLGRGNITNSGLIAGGNAGSAKARYGSGRNGGDGLDLSDGGLTNTGHISGGNGGNGEFGTGGSGGAGVNAINDSGNVIVNAGTIFGGTGGSNYLQGYNCGAGGAGVVLGGGSITNRGLILGGNGASAPGHYYATAGGGGGNGLDLSGGGLTNHGQISGGNGGNQPDGGFAGGATIAATGGTGLSATNSNVLNSGLITGGEGGAILHEYGTAGTGGTGVALSDGKMTNTGKIRGGYGGYVNQAASYTAIGGVGGTGVAITGGGVFTNSGLIIGGGGGDNIYTGRQGGYGVVVNGGTLINSGTIEGGAGGQSQGPPGPTGHAVILEGTAQSVLVVDPGAVFSGGVLALTASDVLKFAGTASATLNLAQFSGFKNIAFAAGAKWKIEGSSSDFDQGQTISGFAATDKIDMLDSVAGKAKVSVTKANEVTIKIGKVIYELDIAGAKIGETDFTFSDHILTRTAKPAMSFITPPAAAPTVSAIPTLAEVGHSVLPAPNGWTVPVSTIAAPIHELTRPPPSVLQPGITLHAVWFIFVT